MQTPARFDVFLVSLDPTVGSEIRKTRPCVVISPNEMNRHIATVLVAPLTSGERNYMSRVACTFQERQGQVALDQIRVVDKSRLLKRLGTLTFDESKEVLRILAAIFAPGVDFGR